MASSNLRGKLSNRQAADFLENLTQNHLFNNPNGILQSEDSIQAFGAYSINKTKFGYKIYKNRVETAETASAKNALAWCIADKYYVKNLKEKILQYDAELASRNATISFLKNAISHVNETSRITVLEDKLQDTLYKAKHTRNLLDKCINSAKYYQLKGFENETSRLGIKTSSRKISKGI